jgi:phosphoglycerate kinase
MASRRLVTLDQMPVDGKRVLVRVDFNIAVGADGRVSEWEDYRIEAALDTLHELQQRRCKILLLTHLGRPGEHDEAGDLKPIHRRLEELLKEEVRTAKHLSGDGVEAVVSSLEPGGIVLLPNVRSDEREMSGNQKFAELLAQHADVFINEAFSVCHRAHTSVAFLPQILPGAAGRRTVREVEELEKLRQQPEAPYVAIVSGAKIKTKVGMLRDLLARVDILCIGGQLANVFLAAQGKSTAYFNPDDIAAATSLLSAHADKIVLPTDVVIGDETGEKDVRTVAIDAIPGNTTGIWDIGPASTELFLGKCRQAKTIMWNGPVGRFEVPAYATATNTLAREIAGMSAYRVVGGGDTVIAIEREKVVEKYDHVSIGGGAMIAYLEGKRMPGLEPLWQK